MQEVVTAEKMAAGGDAIGRLADGRVVFVDGALPGERVSVRLQEQRRDFARGTVTEVLDASPHRVAPPCPELARGCGGCGWQHIEPTAQLGLKRAVVADALARTAKLPGAPVDEHGSVSPWGYRTTMRLAVRGDGRVGLRAARSHEVVALSECPVAHPALSSMLADVRVRGAAELGLRVSVASGEASAVALDAKGRPVRGRIQGLPDHVATGPDAVVHETVAGARLRVSAPSFFQSGPQAAELLVRAVAAAAGPWLHRDGAFLDAYGGVGLFGATLGGQQVVLVESSPTATLDAAANLPGARVVRAPFERWEPVPVQLAVVDPARSGLGRAAAAVLAGAEPGLVVLVSCDPVSLARDTTLLAEHGYVLERVMVLDLFPHTPHVEVVTVLDR